MRPRLALLAVVCAAALATGLCGQALAAGGGGHGPDGPAARGAARHRRRHLAVLRRRRRSGHAPAPGQPRSGGGARGLHVGGEHRRVPVGGRRRPRHAPHRHRDGAAAGLGDAREVATLKRYKGFLYQWYDTGNGNVLLNPGQGDCTETTPTQDNCWFVSAVDNGWYASGLIVARQALPGVRDLAEPAARRHGLLHLLRQPGPDRLQHQRVDRRATSRPASSTAASTSTKARPATTTARCTPTRASRCTSAWACTRCPATSGGARGGRCRPSAAPPTRTSPGRASGRCRATGRRSPTRISHKQFQVWEGHYVYPRHLDHVHPDVRRRHVRGPDGQPRRARDRWGTHSFGLADLRWAQVQERYDTQVLHDPVWGMSPSSTPDDTGNYSGYGVQGLAFGAGEGLAQDVCAPAPRRRAPPRTPSRPHASAIALPVIPQQAYANLAGAARRLSGHLQRRRRLL